MDGSQPSILPTDLCDMIGTAAGPLIVDIRSDADLMAIDRLIPGAVHRASQDVEQWWRELPASRPVVVYDLEGGPASQSVAE
jgi:rhodanese-related sulfurtransferase